MSEIQTYNILLFGESGVGKSTTINALANYLHYSNFDQAATGEFVKVIPSRIFLYDLITRKNTIIQDAQTDENERLNESGNSVTNMPKNHEFNFGRKSIRIIDTPGLNDPAGLAADELNMKNILQHLKKFETIHGICILLKTNTTRETADFRRCIDELMNCLPRNVCKNIVFCFTFSRSTLFGAGDGFDTLKDYLNENKNGWEKIELISMENLSGVSNAKNCFFIDNEAFRYLLAKKHGYPFTDEEALDFKNSWDKSVEQTLAMINSITKLEPFEIKHIFDLMDYKKIISEIAKPIDDITSEIAMEMKCLNVQTNDLIKQYESELKLIQTYVQKLINFIVINSNTNCHNLIKPYLNLFTNQGKPIDLKISNNSQNSSKRIKISNENAISSSQETKTKLSNIINLIKLDQNITKADELEKMENGLIRKLEYSKSKIKVIFDGKENMPHVLSNNLDVQSSDATFAAPKKDNISSRSPPSEAKKLIKQAHLSTSKSSVNKQASQVDENKNKFTAEKSNEYPEDKPIITRQPKSSKDVYVNRNLESETNKSVSNQQSFSQSSQEPLNNDVERQEISRSPKNGCEICIDGTVECCNVCIDGTIECCNVCIDGTIECCNACIHGCILCMQGCMSEIALMLQRCC